MTNISIPVLLFFLFISQASSSPTDFIEALIHSKSDIESYIDESELSRSQRLDINYSGVKNKFLISYDIDEEIKININNGKYEYFLDEAKYEEGYSKLIFTIPAISYTKIFYFHNDKFINPSNYFTRSWKIKTSKYFNFKISEPKYFNQYCINMLDEFVDSLCSNLNVEPQRKTLLEKEKIDYILCKDENEVKDITGFNTKGQLITAFDEVVTSYNTHYHEVAHLLINFKLQNLGLYTLPFFLEGFAVAVGGRGGMSSRVVTDIGYYLEQTGLLNYNSIITNDSFYNNDASLTYAVSGLYNKFLIDELGPEKYLVLYKKVNGDLNYVTGIKQSQISLPEFSVFQKFLNSYHLNDYINFNDLDTNQSLLERLPDLIIDSQNHFQFFISNKRILNGRGEPVNPEYVSRKFIESFPGQSFNKNIQYAIYANPKSVKIYNLYNDELIYSFDSNFSLENISIPEWRGYYLFKIRKDLFEK